MALKKRKCPKCREMTGVPIRYGEPTEETVEAYRRGDIAIGGCCEELGAPTHQCGACGYQWSTRPGMRLVGYCLLHLRSSDTSFATVILYGITNLEQLADSMRECSLRERTRRRMTTFVQA
jgi:hypothetical protein